MKSFLGLLACISISFAFPEPPRARVVTPQKTFSLPQQQYLPAESPKPEYGSPAEEYGPPPAPVYSTPVQEYGPPQQAYGPPAEEYGPPIQKIITKNVYVHVPPEEPTQIIKSQAIETPVPKKHYKIIFIKAPAPPAPLKQTVPLQPQDEHKTLVYVLVKKPEEQAPLVIPSPEPTEPSKPEVYFIKYKHTEQPPSTQYGPPPTNNKYGPPPPSSRYTFQH